jgi:uncharacterized protein
MTDPLSTDVAFTPAVKAMQERLGARKLMQRMSENHGFRPHITPDLAAFIATCESFFLGTASADGQPYIQHRGGKPGFLEVVDVKTLRFFDLPGNRQYITLGNLSENGRVILFLIDYETKTRIKIWGRAQVLDLETKERSISITLEAWDLNCQQHLPALYREATVATATETLLARIATLEAQIVSLKGEAG